MRSMSQAVYGKVQDMQDSFLHKVAEAHLLPQRQRRRPSAGSSAACKRDGLGNSPRISAAGSAPAAQAAKRTGSLRVPPVRGSVIEMVSDEVRAWYCIMSCNYWMTPQCAGGMTDTKSDGLRAWCIYTAAACINMRSWGSAWACTACL